MTNVTTLRPDAAPVFTMPHNYEAEQALLAALLASNRVFGMIVGMVTAEDFADALHGRIFTAICRLIEQGKVANFLTLRDHFAGDPALVDVGGAKYLARLENSVVTIINADDYARQVRDLADRRRLILACDAAINDAQRVDIERPATAIMASLVAEVQDGVGGSDDGLVTVADVAERVVEAMNQELPCFPTGIRKLDAEIGGGLYGQKFYGIAADHKAGKSLLMATIAFNMTMADVPTLYLSLEMGPDEQVQRIMARLMGHNSLAFLDRRARRSAGLQGEAAEAAMELRRHNHLLLMQRPRMALDDVRSTIASAVLRRGIKGVFVDYLQLVDGQRRNESLPSHYDNVAQALAEATKRYGIWIMTAAQTNRDGGIRQGDGLLKACDLALKLHKIDGLNVPDMGWLEMMASRFTPRSNIGSDKDPAFEIDTKAGPHFREVR